MKKSVSDRIALEVGARAVGMTGVGFLNLLRRAGMAIRDDGRWYLSRADLERIKEARAVLGARPRKRRCDVAEAAA